jgi:hypothetical protein
MIPEYLVAYIHGPMGLLLGTRDERLRPCASWLSGAVVDAANDEITVFLADVYCEKPLKNLQQNGMVALTLGHGPAHEAYQFKGTFIESRPTTEQDIAIQELHKTKTIEHFSKEGGEAMGAVLAAIEVHPSTAIRFKVGEIFDQTPGPNAGNRIEF